MNESLDHIRADIRSFIADYCFIEKESLDDDAELLSSEMLDSLGLMQLVDHLSQSYGIEISATDLTLENCDSVNRICQMVAAKRS